MVHSLAISTRPIKRCKASYVGKGTAKCLQSELAHDANILITRVFIRVPLDGRLAVREFDGILGANVVAQAQGPHRIAPRHARVGHDAFVVTNILTYPTPYLQLEDAPVHACSDGVK